MSLIAPNLAAPNLAPLWFSLVEPIYETMLTIEDGTIVTDADSYVTIADVATHALRYGHTWAGTDTEKEQAILRAMTFIEDSEGVFCGSRVSASQELSWPREYVPDAKGTGYLASDAIPKGIKNAVMEAAILESASAFTLLQSELTVTGKIVRKKEKIGPLEEETQYSDMGGQSYKEFERISAFLRPYICDGDGRIVRG